MKILKVLLCSLIALWQAGVHQETPGIVDFEEGLGTEAPAACKRESSRFCILLLTVSLCVSAVTSLV